MADQVVPLGIDVSVPNAARMYDYYLGGNNNFPADREAAEKVLRAAPWIRATALENRAFLGRAVESLTAEAGIRQFVDVGTGLPTRGNVHEVAHRVAPDTRVVYVDNDPVVLGHNRALLASQPNATTVRADLRRPATVISNPALNSLIDWGKPVALLLVAVLHFLTDEVNPADIITQFRTVMAPGSHIVISHLHHPDGGEPLRHVIAIYQKANVPLLARTHQQILAYFTGFDLLEPGLVPLNRWRPAHKPEAAGEVWGLGGVGRLQ
ncbi:MAG TPA: SAM-dependent methyltransferase [Streptosporangiaceae bacterium]|nr:SAM-dependent methyltransferase [Streptosporangiaceae bacterium]